MRPMLYALCAMFAIAALAAFAQENAVVSETSNTGTSMPNSGASPQSESASSASADSIEIVGTVVHKGIEGGFFAIDADDGSKYDPTNLPESFKKDGLRVKVSARLEKDLMSFHMYGVLIEVLKIEAL